MAHPNDFIIDGLTENAVLPADKTFYTPRTIVDQSLEYIDPTPNVFTLFMQFNKRFFNNKLDSAIVQWSKRMTSCAGICTFQPRSRSCVISLSLPLLKLRPRKDLVETLLHEMIHGYLFLKNARDNSRDGHGPEFQKHMNRINREAGTNITIYHDFIDEVKLYQTHWWRCNGPCQKRAPYFGMIRRTTNRAPGKYDRWWAEHQLTCGGTFIKVKEPESTKKKTSSKKENNSSKKNKSTKEDSSMWKWLKTGDKPTSNGPSTMKTSGSTNVGSTKFGSFGSSKTVTTSSTKPTDPGIKKLGNSTNSVHGFGTGGPGSSSSSSGSTGSQIKTSNPVSSSGVLGGLGSGRSRLLDNYFNKSPGPAKNNFPASVDNTFKPKQDTQKMACPICHKMVPEEVINNHIDLCLQDEQRRAKNREDVFDTIEISEEPEIRCPICQTPCSSNEQLNDHLDYCIEAPSCSKKRKTEEVIEILDSPPCAAYNETEHKCLICNSVLDKNVTLDEHLDECIGDMFEEDTINDEIEQKHVKSKDKENSEDHKFPCPVCLALMEEHDMNDHLDICLNSEQK